METDKNFSDSILWKKAKELVNNMNHFTDTLPTEDLYEIRLRLKNAIAPLPEKIAYGMQMDSKIEHIRMKITANSYLEECRNYLDIVERLKFGNTCKLKSEIDEISKLLIHDKIN